MSDILKRLILPFQIFVLKIRSNIYILQYRVFYYLNDYKYEKANVNKKEVLKGMKQEVI